MANTFKIAMLDIETTSLDATYGRFLVGCMKFLDEKKVRTVTAPTYADEPKALATMMDWVDEADVICTWNGKMFDIPFLNARVMIRRRDKYLARRKPILNPMVKHKDLMYECKKLRTRGSRLDGAAKDLGFDRQKFDVNGEHWIKAADGQKASLNLIKKHCELDVLITEDAFDTFRPYILNITR